MSSLSGDDDDDDECRFFDAPDEIASSSGTTSSSSDDDGVWIRSPVSVEERRCKFLNWMGLKSLRNGSPEIFRSIYDKNSLIGETLLEMSTEFQDESSSPSTSLNVSGTSSNPAALADGIECRKTENPQLLSSSLIEQRKQKDSGSNIRKGLNRVKNRWLSRLRSVTCSVDRTGGVADSLTAANNNRKSSKLQRVKIRQHKKHSEELSALYIGQEILAHDGSILTMKFSQDGQFLATAGEDGIVCVWQVMEDLRSNETDIPDTDSSCVYFTVNHLSELVPLIIVDKEKISKIKGIRKSSDSACVIFPPKIFRILEMPLHRFHGHVAEVLDLSWSKNNYLLSSSVDNTVRLWKLGSDECLKVFPHGNYVTCVQFKPTSDDYFISGSIDGKVRVWDIASCHVVDWTDTRDIVTAVCFRPDGQGSVVGSITGACRFYNILDGHFQLKNKICLDGKRKAPNKRITGFQFFPRDPSKVMVTCADSEVRILDENGVIGKYRGLRSTGSQISASFASDGMHIVSTCEDSNVYLWNCINEEDLLLPNPKVVRSWERFPSSASVALPWLGLKSSGNTENGWQFNAMDQACPNNFPLPSPAYFSLSPEFVLESFPKVSATWPEEKLPCSYSSTRAMASALRKSQYKFLKTSCLRTSSTHAWGMVIVTAGWDGRIRSFHNYGLPVEL